MQSIHPSSGSQVLIGIAVVFIILACSWWLAGLVTKRKFDRREQGRNAASSVFAEIKMTYTHFKGKYMPLALSKLLLEAGQVRLDLEHRAWRIEHPNQLSEIVGEANAVIERIRLEVASTFTKEAQEADRLELIAELASVEDQAATSRVDADEVYQEALGQIASDLENARRRIAEALEMLAALALPEGFKSLCQENFDRYLANVHAYMIGQKYIMDAKSSQAVPVCEQFMRDVEAYLHLPAAQIGKFRTEVRVLLARNAVENQTGAVPYTSHATLGRAIEAFVLDRSRA